MSNYAMYEFIKNHLKIIISVIIGFILFIFLIKDEENTEIPIKKAVKPNLNNNLNNINAKNKALKEKLNGKSITGKSKKSNQSGQPITDDKKGKGKTEERPEPTNPPIKPDLEPTDPPNEPTV